MDIAEVAKRSGLSASVGRRGLRRLFSIDVLARLALIALGRSSGFSLDEIARMLGAGGQPQIDRQLLVDKADELDAIARKLIVMRDGLRHAAVCSAPSHMECPTFRRLLGLAAAGVFRRTKKKPAL